MATSSLPDSVFNNVEINGAAQSFDLTFSGLNTKVCQRMALDSTDLGYLSVKTPDCTNGNLVVSYPHNEIDPNFGYANI